MGTSMEVNGLLVDDAISSRGPSCRQANLIIFLDGGAVKDLELLSLMDLR